MTVCTRLGMNTEGNTKWVSDRILVKESESLAHLHRIQIQHLQLQWYDPSSYQEYGSRPTQREEKVIWQPRLHVCSYARGINCINREMQPN